MNKSMKSDFFFFLDDKNNLEGREQNLSCNILDDLLACEVAPS